MRTARVSVRASGGKSGRFLLSQVHRFKGSFQSLLSRYSEGTSSSGTSRVRTSPWSGSSAFSTPLTTSASKSCPSAASSSTLSESTYSVRDSPCVAPDWPAEEAPRPLRGLGEPTSNGVSPRYNLRPWKGFLRTASFFARFDFLLDADLRGFTFLFLAVFWRVDFFRLTDFFLRIGFRLAMRRV